jgi:hypothetical protein
MSISRVSRVRILVSVYISFLSGHLLARRQAFSSKIKSDFNSTVCVVGSIDNYYKEPINSTNTRYAGYYDTILTLCYHSDTCSQ